MEPMRRDMVGAGLLALVLMGVVALIFVLTWQGAA
jgi:hypothetical protein